MSTPNLPVSIQDQIKAMAANNQKNVTTSGGSKIAIKQGAFNLPDGSKVTDELNGVVLAYAAKNVFYEHGYDPDTTEPPLCFALGEDANNMVPSENASEPQADTCKECPNDKWGSGVGNAKACTNRRLLAVLPEDSSDPADELLMIDAAPSSIKNFDGYVASLSQRQEIPLQWATTIGLDTSVDYTKLTFKPKHPNANTEAHFGRIEEAQKLVLREPTYTQSSEGAPKPKAKRQTRRRAK